MVTHVGRGVFSGDQACHSIGTNVSGGLSSTSEFLVCHLSIFVADCCIAVEGGLSALHSTTALIISF